MYLDDQVLKVSQVPPEVLDVQGLTGPKGREEILVLEASLDNKVSRDPEGTLVFQVLRVRLLMAAGGRTASRGVPEPKASPERSWEPHPDPPDRTVSRESPETRASRGRREDLDCLVATDVTVFPV